jgi:hypothetical protein
LKCSRLGITGEALFAHLTREHDAEVAKANAPPPPPEPTLEEKRARFAEVIAASMKKEDEERQAAPRIETEPTDFDHVLRVDEACYSAAQPLPPMSPWWKWSIGEFFATGKPWGIWCVGRGGGKSSTWERVAAALARYGKRKVPPGQTWTMPFISVGPDDANRRINGIAAVFRADGLSIVGDFDEDGARVKPGATDAVKITRAPRGALDLIDAHGNAIQLASIAGTIGNVSGPSTIAILIDEAAKLHDRTTNANPLTEIVASAAQTSRGRAGWRGIICSSAFDRSGLHFQMVEAGDSLTNFVARIGAGFLDDALAGFESVAAWEQRRGDLDAAKRIRAHAASLKADSPLVPTWVANPTLGHPDGIAWSGAALASRMLAEHLPEESLEGVPRVLFWLRENGSVPLDKGETGANAAAQCALVGSWAGRIGGRGTGRMPPIMPLKGAPPGDPRYAGPQGRGSGGKAIGWRKRTMF